MFAARRYWVVFGLLAIFLKAEGADKYTDENRPYEFGFNIEGEQHRHEKKDENGLIMGEFGFITADGVYHVTVYATDENGAFKILSMKNIRVKPYPTDGARQSSGKALQLPPQQSPQPPPQQQPVSLEPPVKSCSHCSIPTSPKPPQVVYNPNEQFSPNPVNNQRNPGQIQYPDQPNANYPQQNYPQQNNLQPGLGDRNPKQYNPNTIDDPDNVSIDTRFGTPDNNQYQPIQKPMLISAQMQIVDKNTDIYSRGPGEREGLPAGVNKNDMMTLLYTFNYTVGFHGHHEEGYTNGAKKGYYYVTGRNGVRTRIDYTADEQGFHPKISQEVLDLLSDDVPKPETEKDEKYGLKGYEFKWLYYPVGSKR